MGDLARMERSNRFALEFDVELDRLGDRVTRSDSDDIIRIDGEPVFDPGVANDNDLVEAVSGSFGILSSCIKARLATSDLISLEDNSDVASVDDLIDEMMEAFAERDTEGIAEVFNTICSADIDPLGDDRYRHCDGGEIDGDQALTICRDTLTDGMDGEDLVGFYNATMSDHIVYDVDNDEFRRFTCN